MLLILYTVAQAHQSQACFRKRNPSHGSISGGHPRSQQGGPAPEQSREPRLVQHSGSSEAAGVTFGHTPQPVGERLFSPGQAATMPSSPLAQPGPRRRSCAILVLCWHVDTAVPWLQRRDQEGADASSSSGFPPCCAFNAIWGVGMARGPLMSATINIKDSTAMFRMDTEFLFYSPSHKKPSYSTMPCRPNREIQLPARRLREVFARVAGSRDLQFLGAATWRHQLREPYGQYYGW